MALLHIYEEFEMENSNFKRSANLNSNLRDGILIKLIVIRIRDSDSEVSATQWWDNQER